MSDNDGGQYFSKQTQKVNSLGSALRKAPQRKATPEDIERWAQESGMGKGKKADALGDEPYAWSDENRGSLDEQNASQSMDELDRAEKEDKGLRGSVY